MPGPNSDQGDALVRLARLALVGSREDLLLFLRRETRRLEKAEPATAERLHNLLRSAPAPASPLRDEGADLVPVDRDSRLQLIRHEHPVVLDEEPVWSPPLDTGLRRVIAERRDIDKLLAEGVDPSRSILLHGAPGVGKSLAARWLARELELPLLTLDLSAVMSSFLGRTGSNVRHVLEYAKATRSVLLVDEFDAIAKRRDDAIEVGELKRLVTVLLQEIDSWPVSGLLVAATNHPQLLDPAIWRRFDVVIEFPLPERSLLHRAITAWLAGLANINGWATVLAVLFESASFSDVRRAIMSVRRRAIIERTPIEEQIEKFVAEHAKVLDRRRRAELATGLVEAGLSQRKAHEYTGVSRDTIRKVKST